MNADQEYGEILHRSLAPHGGEVSLPDALVSRLVSEHSIEDVARIHSAVLEQRLEGADADARRTLLLRATRALAAVFTRFGWAAALPCPERADAPHHLDTSDPADMAREIERLSRALAESDARLRRAAALDPLTGVLNARQFFAALESHLAQARQWAKPLGLVVADLDGFGDYNLRFGRKAGDAALVEVAGLLLRCCRASDPVARFASDAFAIICPGTDLRGALVLAERLRDTLERRDLPHHRFTASFGVAGFPCDADTEEQLLAQARQAAALAFRFGGNAVHASLVPTLQSADD